MTLIANAATNQVSMRFISDIGAPSKSVAAEPSG